MPNMGMARNILRKRESNKHVNFDAHWTSGAKKRRFSDFLSNRLVVKFLSP